MDGSLEHRIACRARRWTRSAGRQLTLAASVVACLLLASAAPVTAAARPVPGGYGDLVGRNPWAGWFIEPPIQWAIWAAWPHVTCEGADGAWHANNVSIRCTAFDLGSGLVDPADASLSLSTDVPAGAVDADASTGTRPICNAIGNCQIVAPVSGNRVDRRPPEIVASVAPVAGPYAAGAAVQVDFTCTDSGSGIRWCPFGETLDTSVPGFHRAWFHAIDVAGNVASIVIDYTVVAGCSTPMIVFPVPGGAWV